MNKLILFILLLIPLINACKKDDLQAARVAQTILSDSSKMALQSAIEILKPGSNILLADNAFIDNNAITVERRFQTGRNLDQPEHFKLWTTQNYCILEYVEGEVFAEVPGLPCTPLKTN